MDRELFRTLLHLELYRTVTVIPPTQEDTVLGSRKNTVRVRNVAQKVNSLCFSLRSLLFHTVRSKSDNCHAALLSFSLISHSSLYLTNRLRTPVYICLNLLER